VSARAEGGRPVRADTWITDTLAQWQAQRPGAGARYDGDASLAALTIVADATLAQALHTLVNNAADAQRDTTAAAVDVRATAAGPDLLIEVADRGIGMSAAQRASAGLAPRTDGAGGGMGIGLFLARRALERCGGSLAFSARDGGGTVARMTIPLERITP
jgi:two-component system, sensor histidine kinase RegB